MRRLAILAVPLALLVALASPASAAEPDRPKVGLDGRWLTQTALYHQDGFLTDKACWKNTGNGRTYCLVESAYIAHQGNLSHPEVFLNVTRSYGGVTVNSPANWAISPYQLLRFGNGYGGAPAEVFTSSNPADPDCRTGPITWRGADRTVPFPGLSAYQLSRVSGVKARFLTGSDCTSGHLTNNYHGGSRRTNTETSPYPHAWTTDPTYTGLHAI